MDAHPLRREIIVTQVVNDLVNLAGITFFHRLASETGADRGRAHPRPLVAREIFGSPAAARRSSRARQPGRRAGADPDAARVRTLVERATRWLVNNRRPPLDTQATVEHFGTPVQAWCASCPSC